MPLASLYVYKGYNRGLKPGYMNSIFKHDGVVEGQWLYIDEFNWSHDRGSPVVINICRTQIDALVTLRGVSI